MTSTILHVVVFTVSSLLVASCGSYIDAFVLPMDETSARALGAPEFAFRTILLVRLGITVLGCFAFAVSSLLSRRTARDRAQGGMLTTLLYGAAYSAVIFSLGELAVLTKGPAVIVMWVVVLALPVYAGRRLALG